jgi:hypothetical protein
MPENEKTPGTGLNHEHRLSPVVMWTVCVAPPLFAAGLWLFHHYVG